MNHSKRRAAGLRLHAVDRARTALWGAAAGALCGMLCCCLVLPGYAEFPRLTGQPYLAQRSGQGAKTASQRTKTGATQTKTTSKVTSKTASLTQRQRVLQALNRFTFGPREGDEASVSRMGLEPWFQQQLHPDTLPDETFETRLAQFPAMQLGQADLIERFPSPGMLRQYSRDGAFQASVPTAGQTPTVEQTIYADAALSYQEKLEARSAAQPAAPGAVGMMQPGAEGTDAAAAAEAKGASAVNNDAPQELGRAGKKNHMPPMDREAALAIVALPPTARMAKLLSLSPAEMQAFQEAVKGAARQRLNAGLTPVQVEQVAAMQAPLRVVSAEALSVRLLRDVYSTRQLQAVMTDFWLNHFNVYLRKNQNEPYLLPAFERNAILPHALGRFEDLLVATAQSPAMLVYLDNATSTGPDSPAAKRLEGQLAARLASPVAASPAGVPLPGQTSRPAGKQARRSVGINENYARELMELHTLGVNGGYTQQDVIEVAKCFTGWTTAPARDGAEFRFLPNRHEPGPKTVLGQVIREGDESEGLAVLHLLASSPATARFLSTELAERFVSDTPPPALVERMTAAYLQSDGDIATVLLTMFHSPEFWSPAVYRAKVKTPLEFVVSALRASDGAVDDPVPLVQALARLGMPLYGMQTPNGYSWQADAWVSSSALLARMNFALLLSGNRLPGTRLDWAKQLALDPDVIPNVAAEGRLEYALLGQAAAPGTRDAVLAEARDPIAQQNAEQSFLGEAVEDKQTTGGSRSPLRVEAQRLQGANLKESPLATAAGLLLGSPDFQRR